MKTSVLVAAIAAMGAPVALPRRRYSRTLTPAQRKAHRVAKRARKAKRKAVAAARRRNWGRRG